MVTERKVKWSKEAQEFFAKAQDNSIVLDLVIWACERICVKLPFSIVNFYPK
jgi:hypothetical protein